MGAAEKKQPPMELVEHGEMYIRLDEEEIRLLAECYPKALDVRLLGGGKYLLRAGSLVGTIVTPRRTIRIRPKCPISSLFYMLGWAEGLAWLADTRTPYADVDDFWEFLIGLVVGSLEKLAKRHLHRGYVEREDNLPALRGRLLVEEHLRRVRPADLTLPCRFEELTPDTVHNQIVRFTLSQLPLPRSSLMALRLRRLRALFSFAEARRFTPADLGKVSYDRLSEHYRPIHALCRLILEGRGLDHPAGSYPLGSFLLNMDVLFERYVGAWLEEHMPRPFRVERQFADHLDIGRRIGIRPDLVISRTGKAVLVADTKYKRAAAKGVSSSDAYQMVAYCRAIGVGTGVLVYPEMTSLLSGFGGGEDPTFRPSTATYGGFPPS